MGNRLLYSTYFGADRVDCSGGSHCIGKFGNTSATAIAVDGAGAVVIAGSTTAYQLPVTPGTLGQQCLCTDTVTTGFVAKFAAGGAQLMWATYVPANVSVAAVILDNSGNVILGGSTSPGFPVTKGALQVAHPAGEPPPTYAMHAGFVSKIDSLGQRFLFSTYLGGPGGVAALSTDKQGNIWATGSSVPSELPLPDSIPALGSTYIVALSPDGSTVVRAMTAPAGAAGSGLVITPQGTVAGLGTPISLLISASNQSTSVVGVANSAALEVSGKIAPYELVSFYGIGIGPINAFGSQLVNGRLTASLGGVWVLFDGVAAPLLYAGPNQINAVVPASVYGRSSTAVQITTPTGTITGPSLSVVASEPEVFVNPPPPWDRLAVNARALNQDGSANSDSNPAARGSVVTIWATGAGISNGAVPDGSIVSSVSGTALHTPVLPVSIVSDSNRLEVLYAGDAPGMVAGVLQVNFRLPAQTLLGAHYVACQLQVGSAAGYFVIYVQPRFL